MLAGISSRLTSLTYLLCPDYEEEPEDVLARLHIEPINQDALHIFYRTDGHFIPVDRWSGSQAEAEAQEAFEFLPQLSDPGVEIVKEILSKCAETVGFELKLSDARGMGWPVAIGAAAHLVQAGQGIIYGDDVGWMVPSGTDVDLIVQE